MTGIACLKVYGRTVMGEDSAATCVRTHAMSLTATPKVFKKSNCLIGYTSSFRMGYLLEHALDIPPINPDRSLDYWANVDFINAVRKCLSEGGYLTKEREVETGGNFLLAVRDQIYSVENDLQVNRRLGTFDACGSGSETILGSLYTSHRMELSPVERVCLALESAARFNITVQPPFHIVELLHED